MKNGLQRARAGAPARRAIIVLAFVAFIAYGNFFKPVYTELMGNDDDAVVATRVAVQPTQTQFPDDHLSPACNPHWKVATSKEGGGNGDGSIDQIISWSATLPIRRIYFYHVRKAGGTMFETYLKKVASRYGIELIRTEHVHAATEEVGSRNDTIYVTNMRDPVERAISHYKYEGRWSCKPGSGELMNKSFVPTEENSRPFESFNDTSGFSPSPCDKPFRFTLCAVQCYIQSFSGKGCTSDNWLTEYHLARNRLLRYNLILSLEQLNDPRYVEAVEDFFGVQGLRGNPRMWCGPQSKEANKKVPLSVDPTLVPKLTRLNRMDYRLYGDLVTSCWGDTQIEDVQYSFPKVNASRFIMKAN